MAGVLTLAQMRSELRFNLDNREATDIPDTTLTRWLNWSYLHVCGPKVYRHPAMQQSQTIALVSGTYTYSLASTVDSIYGIYNVTDGYRLVPRDIRWWDERPRSAAGRPAVYVRWGSSLYLHATPADSDAGKSITVRHLAIPTLLSADGDLTVLTPVWDEIIIMGAAWRGWRSLNRPDHAEIAKQDFTQMVNEVAEVTHTEAEDWGRRREVEVQQYERPA